MSQPQTPPPTRSQTSGYHALGDLMGSYPELAIFRRFRSAGALDLLYQQASLHRAIKSWASTVESDEGFAHRQEFDLQFFKLEDSVGAVALDDGEQWRKWCEISEKLDLYYQKLLKFEKLCRLPEVNKYQLDDLREFLMHDDGGAKFLMDKGENIYSPLNDTLMNEDMISISHMGESDFLTKFSRGPLLAAVHRLTHEDRSGRTVRTPRLDGRSHRQFFLVQRSEETIHTISRVLYACVTTLFIALAILTLNKVNGFAARLSLIVIHNLIFTVGMAFLTQVKPVELFAVAAAYAAVLVVFASGSFGLTKSSSGQ